MKIHTFQATVDFNSHRNMIIPCFWIDSDETCDNCLFKSVCNNALLVDIRPKYLKEMSGYEEFFLDARKLEHQSNRIGCKIDHNKKNSFFELNISSKARRQ